MNRIAAPDRQVAQGAKQVPSKAVASQRFGTAGSRVTGSVVARHVLQFIVAGLLALVVLTAASVVASRRAGTDQAIQDASERTSAISRTLLEENLTPELLAGDPEAVGKLEYRMSQVIKTESFLHLRVWNEDGLIIYSDQPGVTGTRSELGEEAREAFATGKVVAEVSELDEEENILERDQGRLLEVYQPVTALDGTPLLFETYDSFTNVDRSARQIWWSFLPAVLIPLALLQLVQIPFAFRLARKVEKAQNERAELLERVISTSDSERRSIAHDLHDGAVQDLAGVGYSLSVVSNRAEERDDHRSLELLNGVQADIRRSIKSLRSLFVEIYPPNLQRSGLQVALSDLLAAIVGRGIDAVLWYPDDLELAPETNQVLYRVAQEATRNVVRHANATKLDVEIAEVPGGVTLRVADDGDGFDIEDLDANSAGHFGIRIMRDLAIESNGVLDIYSQAGAGTDLRLQLPR